MISSTQVRPPAGPGGVTRLTIRPIDDHGDRAGDVVPEERDVGERRGQADRGHPADQPDEGAVGVARGNPIARMNTPRIEP